MTPRRDPWLALQLELRDGVLILKDRRHDRSEERADGGRTSLVGNRIRYAEDLTSWITDTLDQLGDEFGPHSTGPIVLPVFCRAGTGLPRHLPVGIAAIVEEWLDTHVAVDWTRVLVVPEPARRTRRRKAAALPLTIRGGGETGARVLEIIGSAYWISGVPDEDGLALDWVEPAATWPGGTDIAVADAPVVPDLATMLFASSGPLPEVDPTLLADATAGLRAGRPRLTLLALEDAIAEHPLGLRTILAGADPLPCATLWCARGLLMETDFPQMLTQGIVHDLPLHQAYVAALRMTMGPDGLRGSHPLPTDWEDDIPETLEKAAWAAPTLLVADVVATQGLRLRDTALEMLDEALDLQLELKFREEAVSRVADRLGPLASELGPALQRITSILDDFDWDDFYAIARYDFTQESIGLQPRARAGTGLRRVSRELREAARRIGDSLDETARREIAESQERRVDVTLQRRSPDQDDLIPVSRSTRLAAGGLYRLRVAIGRLSVETLVKGDSPAFDTLLPVAPPGQGHRLTLVLDPLDFESEGWRAKPLRLPPLGPSKAVNFEITAPRKPGPARLRLLVYLDYTPDEDGAGRPQARNHLVQSLLLETEVAEVEEYADEDVTRAVVEVSKTLDFNNLAAFGPRALSIAFNDDPTGVIHNLVLKIGSSVERITLDTPLMEHGQEAARAILRNAVFDDPDKLDGPRFLGTSQTQEETKAFEDAVRALATLGAECYNATMLLPHMLLKAKELSTATGDVIEVTPLRRTFYPWQIIYDALLPPPNAPVCGGYRRNDTAGVPLTPRACLDTCIAGDRSGAFCVHGFWGARFSIAQNFGKYDVPTTAVPSVRRAVGVSAGVPGGPALSLATDLAGALGTERVTDIGAATDLVELLWKEADRPSLILIIGHTAPEPAPPGIEPQPNITLPGGRFLNPRDISNMWRKESRPLAEPAPVVVLAACDSAQADLARWVGFIEPLGRAQAAGVVGLEIPVTQNFAVDLSRHVALSMCGETGRQSLIDAIRAFRQALLVKGSPLGFCVTSFGDTSFVFDNERAPL